MHAVCGLVEEIGYSILEYQVGAELKYSVRRGISAEVAHSLLNRQHCTSRIVN